MAIDESNRAAVHAYLSPRAHAAWQQFSEDNGCSVTSLLESLGLDLHEDMKVHDAEDIRQDWVKRSRRIDAERRKRGRR
jgi:hypothetical protein